MTNMANEVSRRIPLDVAHPVIESSYREAPDSVRRTVALT